ncbi:MAG TPA: hypothetical protein VM010_02005 [Chitinophagaceae bacterium]|nr:hypothetical protein [Chitinophagaceae bacterium]
MINRNRDLLLLMKAPSSSDEAFERHVEELHKVLLQVECIDAFCAAHELATRTRITHKKAKLMRVLSTAELKPFHFLIAKN